MPDGSLRVTRSCSIPPDELDWRFTASGGPGGQHANRSNTRVELVFDVQRSAALGPRQRQRLMARLGPVVRVVAAGTRSQARNREIALERLADRLATGLAASKPRLPTRPTVQSRARRLDEKRQRSELKRSRQRPGPQD